jgi:hypothetical protein
MRELDNAPILAPTSCELPGTRHTLRCEINVEQLAPAGLVSFMEGLILIDCILKKY